MNEHLYKLKQEFLEEWPLERLQNITLDEYTNTNREDSFCYWLEHKTRDLGSIVGGSSYKFGIYKMQNNSQTESARNRDNDGVFAWHIKYGNTAQEAFNEVKRLIVLIASKAIANTLEPIDTIDLGHAYKWKIAFLYSDYNVVNMFQEDALKHVADHLVIWFDKKTTVSSFHYSILKQKEEDKDYYEYTKALWEQHQKLNQEELDKFKKWLKKTNTIDSGKVSSYVRAIEILVNHFEVSILEVLDISVLEDLYKDLKEHQKDKNGKYYFDASPSYGVSGYYSAAVKSYIVYRKSNLAMNTTKCELFKLYKNYLESHRKSDIAPVTINGYVESAELHIPKRWNESYTEDFKFFKINKKNLNKLLPLLLKGFSGYTSFQPFVEYLQENLGDENSYQCLNTILYGPPGTGKTYATIQKAVEIANPLFEIVDSESGRKLLKNEYDRLIEEKRIVFTTFHQSMAYEDFVEGIKPDTKENQLTYSIEDGIFKQLIEEAKELPSIDIKDHVDFSNSKFFKMSLGGKHRKSIHDWCLNNDYIALGWGGDKDLNDVEENRFKEEFYELNPSLLEHSKYHVQSSAMFKNYMGKGDVVIATLGNHIIDAIGVITGDYEFKESNAIHFKHYRKVKWLAKDLNSSPKSIIGKNISQQSIYEFNPDDVNVDKLESMFNSKTNFSISEKLNYVLVIDEINRGNVSAIFGELITLLEESKRLGNEEALTVTLPNSKETFGVPNNLYIIGTMNTADRSVEALDTALRRRFSFVEMMPDVSRIETVATLLDEGIDLSKVLAVMNQRIEVLLDRDHTIGHSYFMKVKDLDGLKATLKNNILPLLQEYFYNDYAKIGMVLGKGFVEEKKSNVKFAAFEKEANEEYASETYALIPVDADFDIKNAIEKLLN